MLTLQPGSIIHFGTIPLPTRSQDSTIHLCLLRHELGLPRLELSQRRQDLDGAVTPLVLLQPCSNFFMGHQGTLRVKQLQSLAYPIKHNHIPCLSWVPDAFAVRLQLCHGFLIENKDTTGP